MAKFKKDVLFKVGDDGEIVLRHPTNKEWNKYQQDKIDSQSEGRSIEASNDVVCDFFDTLVTSITNIQDTDDTEITMDTLGKIKVKEKSGMIMQGIEMNSQGIVLKNS